MLLSKLKNDNRNPDGTFKKGRKHSIEERQKMSESRIKFFKESNGDYKHSEETKRKLSNSHKGLKHTEETKKKISKIKTGFRHSDEMKEFLSELLREKYRSGERRCWNKGKRFPQISGKNSHFWKGGVSTENNKLRHSPEVKLWRKAVFERDGYACFLCGGNKLNAHHLKSWSEYPELRYDINNGLTLCEFCHKTYTKFYKGKNKSK